MTFFPILNVNTYNEMLTKLGYYTFAVTLFCIYLLRRFVPPVAQFSTYIDSLVPAEAKDVFPVPVSFAGLFAFAIGIALLAHAIKLHDRLSDLLRIRKEFDINYVLYPLAAASRPAISLGQFSKIRGQRSNLMASTFYSYASSTRPVIDSHTITQALTNWSWFWVCLEAIAILFGTAITLAFYGEWKTTAFLLIGCSVLLLLMRFFRLQSAVYAESQVEQILRDPVRRASVAAEFNAL
jgi:hypothetical protein